MKLKSKERNIWFTSDTHYGHKNIVRGVSEWDNKDGCRDFKTIEKMNVAVVDGINKYVQPDDILFHLGDWSFGGIDNIGRFRNRLAVEEIHLILGNHDEHIRHDKVIADVDGFSVKTKDLFTSVNDYLEILIDKIPIILSHYPICSWNKAYRGSWMIHGHTHGTLFAEKNIDHWYHQSRIMDVGVDVSFGSLGEYVPWRFEDMKKILSNKNFISIDQHDEKTNG